MMWLHVVVSYVAGLCRNFSRGAGSGGARSGGARSRGALAFAVASLASAALGAGVGCGAVYPELVTTLRAPEADVVLDPPAPADLYYLYFESAVVPARTRDGREWPAGGPTTYARLMIGETTLIKSPPEPGTRKPTWPKQERKNYRIAAGAELTLELWVTDAIQDKPLCQVTVLDLHHLRDGGRNDFDCDSGAHITLGVEPAHAVIGLGFYYELRGSDGVRVTRVLKHSPAARGGLAAGSRIDTIQGKSVVPMDALEVRSAMNANSRAGVRLDVELPGGKRRVLTLKDGPIYPLPEENVDLTPEP